MPNRPKPPPKSTTPAPEVISSRQNPLLKEIIAIRDERGSPLLFMEGPRLIEEALSANFEPEILVVSEDFPQISFLDPIQAKTRRVVKVSDAVFRLISDVEKPQGLLAICRRPKWSWEKIFAKKPLPVIILDGLQVPGNAASIVRTAEAAGVSGIVTTPGTAHLFSPKALRGAMGASLRIPIVEHETVETIVAEVKKAGYQLAGTPLRPTREAIRCDKLDWTKPWAIILGREARGVSSAWEKSLDAVVQIPMHAPVKSLNVAAAAAVLLYESARQRGN